MDVFDNLNLSSSSSSDYDNYIQKQCMDDPINFFNDCSKPDEEVKQKKCFRLFKINRPPSRHRSPPKATGLEFPEEPHTPPKTQKELDEFKEYSYTINVKGINYLTKNPHKKKNSNSDESFSSSKFCILL